MVQDSLNGAKCSENLVLVLNNNLMGDLACVEPPVLNSVLRMSTQIENGDMLCQRYCVITLLVHLVNTIVDRLHEVLEA